MVENFIKEYVKMIAIEPSLIDVKREFDKSTNTANITIYASDADAGRIIGKNGKMISSIKTVISGCKAKDGISYKIVVKSM
ncbi:RNA-binding protein [Helicobacter sp. 16-1353]|uniref:KH domain-containing protein n=1 Tax=Helicobacter sp. 16-1353 TaxID=2004996 RepID=UPI000DCDF011|nr:KH domain-containing protein [Helicobacter sp. 16-1353]RAX52069.1 RNA-binding protein [Helicobacter sp. 16-1353]